MTKKRDWVIGTIILASFVISLLLIYVVSRLALDGGNLTVSSGGRKIAIVEIEGVITDPEPAVRQFRKYGQDKSVPAIVLRIDSPGGGVAASQEIYEEVRKLKKIGKKVVVSMGGTAASGGYYVSAAADTIVANPGTITGSIGVIAELPNVEALFKKVGVQLNVIKSGKFKDTGSPIRRLTDEERQLLQGVINDTFDQFVDAIVSSRKLPRAEVLKIADGRILTGRQAKKYGFVDVLGNYQDAIDIAAIMVGMKKNPPIVKEKTREFSLLDLLFGKATGAFLSEGSRQNFPKFQYILQ